MAALVGFVAVSALLYALFAWLIGSTAGWIAVGVWAVASFLGWLGTRTA
jgi:hypothetical protein